ncbi:uncharacterized protein [Palaemon carinicauda]|uniref:uncharacterized protein n=1 Tax=Palaemon carinicauda TaxID=392227 RepID=UPI0035B5CDDB
MENEKEETQKQENSKNQKEKINTTRIEELESDIAELRRGNEDMREKNIYLKDGLRRLDRHVYTKLWKKNKKIKTLKAEILRAQQINNLLIGQYLHEKGNKGKKEKKRDNCNKNQMKRKKEKKEHVHKVNNKKNQMDRESRIIYKME